MMNREKIAKRLATAVYDGLEAELALSFLGKCWHLAHLEGLIVMELEKIEKEETESVKPKIDSEVAEEKIRGLYDRYD